MDEIIKPLTKEEAMEAILFMKYMLPKIETARYNKETELRKENPFWPFNPPSREELEIMKKWSENEN